MMFPNHYRCLPINMMCLADIQLIPIRYTDRHEIMKWRNEQLDFLRQEEPLGHDTQDEYFKNVLSPLFTLKNPEQILFSILIRGELAGYGGLVHVDWNNLNAEVSFLLRTDLNCEAGYVRVFDIYLRMIVSVAKQVGLHRIYTVGYDICNYRFEPLIGNGFYEEATLRDHVCVNDELCDTRVYGRLV